MINEEIFYRAGGLVAVNAIIEDSISGNHDVTKSELQDKVIAFKA